MKLETIKQAAPLVEEIEKCGLIIDHLRGGAPATLSIGTYAVVFVTADEAETLLNARYDHLRGEARSLGVEFPCDVRPGDEVTLREPVKGEYLPAGTYTVSLVNLDGSFHVGGSYAVWPDRVLGVRR